MSGPGRWLAGAVLAASALAPAACSDHAATSITVAIATEASLPREIDHVSLRITRGTEVRFAQTYDVDPATHMVKLPGTLTVKPRDSEDPGDPILVEIIGNVRDVQVVLRSARMGFVKEKQKLLRLTLRYSCFDVPESCQTSSNMTCVGGRCVDNYIDTSKLPDLGSGEVFPAQGASGCFDATPTSACLIDRVASTPLPDAVAVQVTPTLTSPELYKCRIATTIAATDQATAGKVNVFVLWKAQADQKTPEVLESASPEGWSFQAGTSPLVIELADGLCDAVRDGRISHLSYNHTTCDSKTEGTPICVPTPVSDSDKPFFDDTHACHRCAYFREGSDEPGVTSCRAFFESAVKGTSQPAHPEQKIRAALAADCPYDGHYNGLEECASVRGCFFGALQPFLECKGADCDLYPDLTDWTNCLEGWKPLDASGGGSCVASCGPGAEQANLCQ